MYVCYVSPKIILGEKNENILRKKTGILTRFVLKGKHDKKCSVVIGAIVRFLYVQRHRFIG